MQTEVMRYYGLARRPVDLGFFETENHAQLAHDLKTAIMGGRLIALTATIGSGKTVLTRRLREELKREGRMIVSCAVSLEKAKMSVPLLVAALFYVGAIRIGWLGCNHQCAVNTADCGAMMSMVLSHLWLMTA